MGSYLLMAVIIVIVAVIGVINIQAIQSEMRVMYLENMLPIQKIGDANAVHYALRGDLFKYVLISDQRQATRKNMTSEIQQINAIIDEYRQIPQEDEEKAAQQEFDQAWEKYQAVLADTLELVDAGNQQAAMTNVMDGGVHSNARKALGAALSKIITINIRHASAVQEQSAAIYQFALWFQVIATVVGLLLALVLGLVSARSFIRPLSQVTQTSQLIADRDLPSLSQGLEALARGDLSAQAAFQAQPIDLAQKDEFGQLAAAFNAMIARLQEAGGSFSTMTSNLRQAIGAVAEDAVRLDSASRQLSQAATQSSQAVGQIAATIQQVSHGTNQQSQSINLTATAMEETRRAIEGVARGAQEQAHAVTQTSNAMSRLSSTIDGIRQGARDQVVQMQGASRAQAEMAQAVSKASTAAGEVAQETARAAASAVDGAGIAAQAVQGMQRLQTTTNDLGARIRDLGRRSGQIGAIVETIDDIAAQTNLLALNAAIEAARAGEHGRGFAVVADEVRKLAERSSIATREITDMIRAVQGGANDAVTAMQQAGEDVRSSVEQVDQAGKSFSAIAQGTQASSQRVEAIQAAMRQIHESAERVEKTILQAAQVSERSQLAAEEMNRLSSEVVDRLDSVSAVVEENTASTEEMSASAGEISQAIENIASISEENSAAIEEVTANAEEMSAQVEEVTASAQSLSEMAHGLQRLVSQFQLN